MLLKVHGHDFHWKVRVSERNKAGGNRGIPRNFFTKVHSETCVLRGSSNNVDQQAIERK